MKFMAVNKEHHLLLSVRSQFGGSNVVSIAWAPCAKHSISRWPIVSLGHCIVHLPPSSLPFIFPLMNKSDGYLVPLAWGLMAERHRLTSRQVIQVINKIGRLHGGSPIC